MIGAFGKLNDLLSKLGLLPLFVVCKPKKKISLRIQKFKRIILENAMIFV